MYNTVGPNEAPFFRPHPSENEEKWEAALLDRPNSNAIPFNVRGFYELGLRLINQERTLNILSGRLHEINNGLTDLLRKHDLSISTRAAECRKQHLRLSQKCLALAAKTQILQNRGYQMDAAEEELKRRLLVLEKQTFDAQLNGRSEEIWARMVSVRERGRQLQAEFERAGKSLGAEVAQGIDEETMKRAAKVSPPY